MESPSPDPTLLDERVQQASKAVERAAKQVAKLAPELASGDPELMRKFTAAQRRLEKAQKELEFAMEMQKDVLTAQRAAEPQSPGLRAAAVPAPGDVPRREQMLTVLESIRRPLSGGVIASIARARFEFELPTRQLASVRRDDEFKLYKRDPHSRPAYVAPALDATRLTPIGRLFTSSAWEPILRVMGTRSMRVDHMHTLLSLAKMHAERPTSEMEMLVWRFARNVPDAIDYTSGVDHQRIEAAVKQELAHIEADDLAERQEAAQRFAKLPPYDQVWGRARGEGRLRVIGVQR